MHTLLNNNTKSNNHSITIINESKQIYIYIHISISISISISIISTIVPDSSSSLQPGLERQWHRRHCPAEYSGEKSSLGSRKPFGAGGWQKKGMLQSWLLINTYKYTICLNIFRDVHMFICFFFQGDEHPCVVFFDGHQGFDPEPDVALMEMGLHTVDMGVS